MCSLYRSTHVESNKIGFFILWFFCDLLWFFETALGGNLTGFGKFRGWYRLFHKLGVMYALFGCTCLISAVHCSYSISTVRTASWNRVYTTCSCYSTSRYSKQPLQYIPSHKTSCYSDQPRQNVQPNRAFIRGEPRWERELRFWESNSRRLHAHRLC